MAAWSFSTEGKCCSMSLAALSWSAVVSPSPSRVGSLRVPMLELVWDIAGCAGVGLVCCRLWGWTLADGGGAGRAAIAAEGTTFGEAALEWFAVSRAVAIWVEVERSCRAIGIVSAAIGVCRGCRAAVACRSVAADSSVSWLPVGCEDWSWLGRLGCAVAVGCGDTVVWPLAAVVLLGSVLVG